MIMLRKNPRRKKFTVFAFNRRFNAHHVQGVWAYDPTDAILEILRFLRQDKNEFDVSTVIRGWPEFVHPEVDPKRVLLGPYAPGCL